MKLTLLDDEVIIQTTFDEYTKMQTELIKLDD